MSHCDLLLYWCVALYGTLFSSESEAAFSNYRLWESIGAVVSFGYSFYLCAAVKLYILMSNLVLGMLGYLAVEYLQWKTRESARAGDEALELSLQPSTQSDSAAKSWLFLTRFYRSALYATRSFRSQKCLSVCPSVTA